MWTIPVIQRLTWIPGGEYPGGMRVWPTIVRVLTALTLFLATNSTASATNIVFYTFNASLDTGSLAGTTFSVCYSYDADQVQPSGESYVTLNSFDFTLLGTPFTRSEIFQGGQVIFQDGVAQDVTASFQVFLPPSSPVNNITFGFGGPGVIGYVDLDYQFGDGSFSLDSQTPGCDPALSSSRRSVVRTSPGVRPTPTPTRTATRVSQPAAPRR